VRLGRSRGLAAIGLPVLLVSGFSPALAQDGPAVAQDGKVEAAKAELAVPAEDPVEHVYVALTTEAGVITLDLDATHAPLTTANFLKYVDRKLLDGTTFYRAMHLNWGDEPAGLLQGGLRMDPAKVLPPVAHEPTSQTGILHKAGTISMARYAPGTATADFTIMISDMDALDARPDAADAESRAGFAAFGHVVGGMDVVRRIWDMPRSATAGEGVMKGDMLEKPVRIVTARRLDAPPAPAAGPGEVPAG
jgi:peptidyl-prolyl cis-trans isomerase A (cyclophilin A)